MRRYFVIGTLLILADSFSAAQAFAQAVPRAEIVVPQVSIFTASTTVSVPDRGYTSLGGFRGASERSSEFGPGWGRGFSGSRLAIDSGVRVWIHDFNELEPKASSGGSDSGQPPIGFAARIRQYASNRTSDEKSAESAAAKKPARDAVALFTEQHAADLLKRGCDAEAQGKLKMASFYFKSVAALTNTTSAPIARDRLKVLEPKLAGL